MNDETKAYIKSHLEELRQTTTQLIIINALLDKLPNPEGLDFVALKEAQTYIKIAKGNLDDGIEVLQEIVFGEVS